MDPESPYRPPESGEPPVSSLSAPEGVSAVSGFNRIVGGLGLLWSIYLIVLKTPVAFPHSANEEITLILKALAAACLTWSGILLARKKPSGVQWSNLACGGLIGLALYQFAMPLFVARYSSGALPAGSDILIAFGACLGEIIFPPLIPLLLLRRDEVKAWTRKKPTPAT